MQSGRRSGLSQSTLKTRLSLLFPPSPTAAAPKKPGKQSILLHDPQSTGRSERGGRDRACCSPYPAAER